MKDATPDAPLPDPPRRVFRFKSASFTADNPPVSSPSPHGPTDVREHFALATTSRPAPKPVKTPPNEVQSNDVHQILRDNLAAAEAAGANDLKPVTRRRSHRLRDYAIIMIGGNLLIAAPSWAFRDYPIFLVFALSGFVLFNIRVAWSIWVVLDDY